MSKNNVKNVLIGTLVGVGVGYVAGVLTAPKSGKETRDDIKNMSTDAWNKAEDRLSELQEDLTDVLDVAKSKVKDVSSRRKQELEDLMDNAKDAQDKVKQMLTAVKRGEASDRDLQRAVDAATKAKKHLWSFLRK